MAPKTSGVDVKKLLAQIDFSPDNVVSAAASNSVLFVSAIQFRLQCLQKKTAAKMIYDKTAAETELRLRAEYRKAGEKITEGNLDALVLLDPQVQSVLKSLSSADEYDEYSKLVVEAFRMRRDCLRIVSDQTRDELSLQRSAEIGNEKLRDARQRLNERYPGSE